MRHADGYYEPTKRSNARIKASVTPATAEERVLIDHCEMCGRSNNLRLAPNPSNEIMTLCKLCADGSAEVLVDRFTDPAYAKQERNVARAERAIRRAV